jgi:hypothetical protein
MSPMRRPFAYVHVRHSIWNARPKPIATAVQAENAIVNDPEAAAIALLVRLSPDDLDALSKKNIKEFFALGTRATERVLTKAREDRGKSSQADPGRKSKSRRDAALSRLKSLQCRD